MKTKTETQTHYVVVLPYSETNRLLGSSKAVSQEAFVGPTEANVYYQFEARRLDENQALSIARNSSNVNAFVRKVVVTTESIDINS